MSTNNADELASRYNIFPTLVYNPQNPSNPHRIYEKKQFKDLISIILLKNNEQLAEQFSELILAIFSQLEQANKKIDELEADKNKTFLVPSQFLPIRLGVLIDHLKTYEAANPTLVFSENDKAHFAPNKLTSWRGSYDQLAITSTDTPPYLKYLLSQLEEAATGQVSFEGYKGGTYYMNRETPVWVSNRRESDLLSITATQLDPTTNTLTLILSECEY